MFRSQAAAILLALCGIFLLSVWHYGYYWFWIWDILGHITLKFDMHDTFNIATKIVGVALVAVALLVWRPRKKL